MIKTVERRIRESVQALKLKNLLPKRSLGYFDESHMNQLVYLQNVAPFKEWSCPVCHITVYGPKKLLIEHHKIHSSKRDIGENEHYRVDYNVYR